VTAWPAIKTTTGDGLAALAEFRTPAVNDAIVRAGVGTFLEVGEALARIHAGKQYRELGFASFDAYCRDAAGHGARWGYRLLAAAKSVTDWSQSDSPPTNEWQARAKPKAKPAEPVTVTYDALSDVLPPIGDIAPAAAAERHTDLMTGLMDALTEDTTPEPGETGFVLVPQPPQPPAEECYRAYLALRNAPLRPTPVPDESERWGRTVWRATGPVQAYLDKLTALRQATMDLLADPGNYAKYDATAREVTVGALRATRAQMLELIRALEPKR
jgi:hypothetical protein